MKHARLTRLERLVRERPCPACGRPPAPLGGVEESPEPARLSRAEREELLRLVELSATGPCARCGQAGHEMSRLTDEQLDRALALLRVMFGPEDPLLAGLCAIAEADLDPA